MITALFSRYLEKTGPKYSIAREHQADIAATGKRELSSAFSLS